MLLAYFNRKEYLRHRAVSLRQHGFLVLYDVVINVNNITFGGPEQIFEW